jgi:hypothetical protein
VVVLILRTVSTKSRRAGSVISSTYVFVGDVLGQVDVDDCEAFLDDLGDVVLDRISLRTVSFTVTV